MEGLSLPVPIPSDTPDGGRSTLEGLGPWRPAGGLEAPIAVDAASDEDAVEGRAIDVARDDDAVEGRAVELELSNAAFLGKALLFASFVGAGVPSL